MLRPGRSGEARAVEPEPPCAARRRRRGSPLAVAAALALAASPALAGKARDYLNAPKDSWVTFYNLGWSRSVAPALGGSEFGTGALETDLVSQSLILSRIVDVWGRTGGLSLIVPHASIDSRNGGADGVGDLGFVAEVNLFGAPALSKEAFADWTPETFASAHFVLTAPTGSYDDDRAPNVGANRWSLASTVNYSYTPDAGWTWLELYGTLLLFTENTDAPGAAETLSRDPLWRVEAHASRNLTPDFWVSADAYYDIGGETALDGKGQDDAADTLRAGLGFGLRLPGRVQLMMNADQVIARPSGQPDGFSLRLTLARVW